MEYDRRKPLNKRQKEDLAHVDKQYEKQKKDLSIVRMEDLGEALGKDPTDPIFDPLRFSGVVACALIKALQTGNDQVTAASCTWLAHRIAELRQVKAKIEDSEHISIKLVFNLDSMPEVNFDCGSTFH